MFGTQRSALQVFVTSLTQDDMTSPCRGEITQRGVVAWLCQPPNVLVRCLPQAPLQRRSGMRPCRPRSLAILGGVGERAVASVTWSASARSLDFARDDNGGTSATVSKLLVF